MNIISPNVVVPTKETISILVIDRDDVTRSFLATALAQNGFSVQLADNGLRALWFLNRPLHLVILNPDLSKCDGFRFIQYIRSRSDVPIVVLSSASHTSSCLQAFELGADDFITKPFCIEELLARVRAVIRRTYSLPPQPGRSQGRLRFDKGQQRAFVDDIELVLTPREFHILAVLADHADQNLSRQEIKQHVWGSASGCTRKVDLYVSRVRTKLRAVSAPYQIASVWGIGYRLDLQTSQTVTGP